MPRKFLVTIQRPADIDVVRASGADVLAEYPSAVLVQTGDDGGDFGGLEAAELPEATVRTATARFEFDDALAAEAQDATVTPPDRRCYYLVQLVGPVKDEWLAELATVDAKLHGQLAGFRLLVGMLPQQRSTIESLPYVEQVTPYRPAMKVAPSLRGRQNADLALEDLIAVEDLRDAPARVEITVFEGESAEEVAAAVRASGGTVLTTDARTVIADAPTELLAAVAERQGVEAILPFEFSELHNDQARQIMRVPATASFGSFQLTGSGQIVGIADSGLDTGDAATLHADLAGRATVVSSPNQFGAQSLDPAPNDDGPRDEHAHGTHVAGSVIGNAAAAIAAGSPVRPRGVAPDAEVFFTSIGQRVTWNPAAFAPQPAPAAWGLYGIPGNLANLFQPAYAAGARIHTNSWGNSLPANFGQYTAQSRGVDQFMFDRRDMLILFSAGNNGADANNDIQVDADSVGPPGTAKNCLTVGATESQRPTGSVPAPGLDGVWSARFMRFGMFGATGGHVSDDPDGMALFSSRGPCDDGRTKPDLVAPGTNILSTRTSVYNAATIGRPVGTPPLWGEVAPATDPLRNLYCWSGGTSMSTPLVAGAGALVRQHLVQQRGHFLDGATPSGALIKAILVNGTMPIPGQYTGEVPAARPNNVTGFGRLDVTRAIAPDPLGTVLFSDDPSLALASGQMRVFSVQALDVSAPIRVTLCWTDAPSPVGVGQLQNQLYLQLVPPGGGPAIDADTTAFPVATNNVQMIEVAAPVAGTYEVRVRAINVVTRSAGSGAPAGTVQDFALVVANGMGLSTAPVSIAQVVDTTGSMEYFGFMAPARERATQLADFLRSGDRMSVTEFSERGVGASARTPFPIRTLTSFTPDWADLHTAINGLVGDGLTPIGAGLQAGWAQLAGEAAGRPRGIVLLSDGFNNQPPDPASVLPTIPTDVPIWAVALGPAAFSSALQSIAASRPGGAYFSLATDEDLHHLHEIYATLQALASGSSLIGLDSVSTDDPEHRHLSVDFDIEHGLAEAAFTASWSGAMADVQLIDPHGQPQTESAPAISVVDRSGHRIFRVGLPAPGRWTVRVDDAARGLRLTASAAAPSSLILSAGVRAAWRSTFIVNARLTRRTKGVDDARVTARLIRPRLRVEDVLERYAKHLDRIHLDPLVDEDGLSSVERQLVALAVLGSQATVGPGGLFDREVIEIELEAQGDGLYAALVDLPAPGAVRADIVARGELKGQPWQRHAQLSAVVGSTRVRKPVKPIRRRTDEPIVGAAQP